MSKIQDEAEPSDLTLPLAARLRAEREERGWSIAEMAERSAVSRAMISKVERAEASPTAALLGRLASALGLTLSTLLARAEGDAGGGRVSRADTQPLWRDPDTGYLRRAVTPSGSDPELVRVELPAGARVDYPASTYLTWKHAIWVLEGELLFHEGAARHRLAAGDCLVLGAPADCAFENASGRPCSYLVVLSRR